MSIAVPVAGVILAAGKGTRMKSELPKGLHAVCGLPMVEHIGRAMQDVGVKRPIIVIGYQGDILRSALGDEHYAYSYQTEQLGTGHAVMVTKTMIESFDGPVIVTPGDTPLLTAEALERLVAKHLEAEALASVATCIFDRPKGYGRIVRDASGQPRKIVEEKDATELEKELKEINTGVYCFDSKTLFRLLPKLGNSNAQGEFYLTEIIQLIAQEGGVTQAVIFDDPEQFMGVNDRWQLAAAATQMRTRILKRHALNGVTIVDPSTTHIGADVEIGCDTAIEPMTVIEGTTKIGSGCVIGPMSRVCDATIGDECVVLMSNVNRAEFKEGSRCGPYAHIRPGTTIGQRAKVGNFVEIKNVELGDFAAAAHLTYLGDATIGSGTNIGAGTITCNYDGYGKHRTEIGKNAFIGSNATLVAPITIGDRAMIAAGSTITADVPADALALGRSRQENKEGWAIRWRRKQQAEKK